MAVDPNKRQVSCLYVSDDGNSYSLVVHRNHAVAGSMVASSGQPPYPRKWKPRVIHGISADGLQHCSVVCPANTSTDFVDGAVSIVIAGVGTFTKTGSTGEKRPRPAPPLT